MRKQYFTPLMVVKKIETSNIMALSLTDTPSDDSVVLSRESIDMDFEELDLGDY